MKLTVLGTGNARLLPVYGCNCIACERAKENPAYRRGKTAAFISYQGRNLLLDANAEDLMARFPAGTIDSIVLTHYHMDHVQSLFDLRWGLNMSIPVFGPDDPNGCDDLFKHPGILDFKRPRQAFEHFYWRDIRITPVPLIHSKPCFGYVFECQGKRIAYLTDTVDLPVEVKQWFADNPVELMLIDCSFPPVDRTAGELPSNHNDVVLAKSLKEKCRPKQMGLIHIGHTLESWAMANPYAFDDDFFLVSDGQEFNF